MKVLVVDDEVALAQALARGLRAEGFVVDLAHDGNTGLEAARFGGYDLVILDIMLPGPSGYTLVKTLREEENWVPVLLLSAKDGEYDQADGLDYGADDYLTKPFSFVVLLARIRALLRRDPATPRPTVWQVHGLVVNPGTGQTSVDGRPVDLSRRELGLLTELLRAAPSVVGKHRLLESVWGDEEADPNLVEVYVGYLRRKVGRERILTVRGQGYRIPT